MNRYLVYYNADQFRVSEPVAQGERSEPFRRLHYVPATESIYTIDYNTVRRLNATTRKTEAVLWNVSGEEAALFAVSSDGQRAYAVRDDRLLAIDPLTLSVTQSYPLSNIVQRARIPKALWVTNTNHLLIKGFSSYNGFDADLEVIDMDKAISLARLSIAASSNRVLLSPSGQHFVKGRQVFRITDESVTPVAGFADSDGYSLHQNPTEPESFWVVKGNNVRQVSWQTATTQRRVSLASTPQLVSIDAKTGHLGGVLRSGDQWYYTVFDLSSGDPLSQTLVVAPDSPDASIIYSLQNNTLFSNQGYSLSLTF